MNDTNGEKEKEIISNDKNVKDEQPAELPKNFLDFSTLRIKSNKNDKGNEFETDDKIVDTQISKENDQNTNSLPSLCLTGKKKRPQGGIAARRGLGKLKNVPGIESASKLDFISNRADQLMELKKE